MSSTSAAVRPVVTSVEYTDENAALTAHIATDIVEERVTD